ncbi:MAG: zinc-dependent metalloprotease [Bacteriovoracaceae bacterium]|nr:zinc-dependent metalloprotease [Bacteriovoracaceae bacterium]
MKKMTSSALSLLALGLLSSACMEVRIGQPAKSKNNFVSNATGPVNTEIGDEKVKLHVVSPSELQALKLEGKVMNITAEKAKELFDTLPHTNEKSKTVNKLQTNSELAKQQSLILGFPVGLIGEQSIFGAVITKVSDQTNETLGGLKLTDLSPLHVTTKISNENGVVALSLVGCSSGCDEESAQSSVIDIPIVSVSANMDIIYLDLTTLGSGLDLIKMLDPGGRYTKLTSISSTTTMMDYSVSTLVFDVLTVMVPVGTTDVEAAPKTEFTVRWYLKLNSAFNPAFTARAPTEGVGFFKTERSASPKITRFSTTDFGKTVKYYIKNVPEKYKPIFAKAFDNWNVEFTKILGRDFLSYEFLESTDPRYSVIIPGDIRFNVLEWDLENVAGYGGLGPSIANQFTGETLSANVLIQGPTIMKIYTAWYGVSQTANKLIADGRVGEANALMAKFNHETAADLAQKNKMKFAIKLGSLEMNVRSQNAELEDPMAKKDFEIVPAGVSFDEFMAGYFTDMLSHELGHNLGLRHNFKGNLGAFETGEKGSVSRSIMEYLGRPYRYLDTIGLYDRMAISYGYRGVAPKHLDWFCTDEDQGSDKASLATASPECTKSDATSDPFSFWEKRFARAVDLMVDLKSPSMPAWNAAEISSQVDAATTGIVAYAASAKNTAATWTNFFGKGDRPERDDFAGIRAFVIEAIKKKICNPEIATVIAAKESAEAMKLAQENIEALRAQVAETAAELSDITATELSCK